MRFPEGKACWAENNRALQGWRAIHPPRITLELEDPGEPIWTLGVNEPGWQGSNTQVSGSKIQEKPIKMAVLPFQWTAMGMFSLD